MATAKDIMNRKLITIGPDVTVGAAIRDLLDRGISGFPVVDEDRKLIGLITEFALLAAVYDAEIKSHPVSQHMTRQVITVDADTPIRKIVDTFIVHRVRRLPVLEQGRLVGHISRCDVLRAVMAELRSEALALNA